MHSLSGTLGSSSMKKESVALMFAEGVLPGL